MSIHRIDLLKIDCEGAELEILKGAEESFKKYCNGITWQEWERSN